MFGKLTYEAGFAEVVHEPIILYTVITMVLAAIFVVGIITVMKWWGPLWRNWLTTVDHKRLGVMYSLVGIVMLLRGFADAILMRSQQAVGLGDGIDTGFLPPSHFDQIFSAHGVIMIFFMATPLLFGLMNFVVPLQIGARDVAYPFLNSFAFWLTFSAAVLINISLGVGNFARGGWLAYPPFTGLSGSPDVGMDYYLWALQISGAATLMGAINFTVTILKMRPPSMRLMQMPIFTWSVLVSNVLILIIFPMLTSALGLLTADRYLGTHFFTADGGGNAMAWINYIWMWGHPEVYVLVLPAFGVISEVVATFSSKRLFGHVSMVWALIAILILSFLVWGHHFFTMGAGSNVNAFFGVATMIIAVPTGVKVFNWLFTLYKGRIKFEVPMLFALAMMFTFVGGGLTGVLLAVVPADWQLHNSLFLIAHFHHVLIGGVVYSYLAGVYYWFPKVFGFKLHDGLGKISFWAWFVGFYVAFMPIYCLGLMGATRRMQHYVNPDWQIYFIIAAIGVGIIAIGILAMVAQLLLAVWYGIKMKGKMPMVDGDAWGTGRTLEWALPSPVPEYNFARVPYSDAVDSFWEMKRDNEERPTQFHKIHMPDNTPMGLILGLITLPLGFALVWHIWWLVILSFIIGLGALIVNSYRSQDGHYIDVAEIEEVETKYSKLLQEKGVK